MNTLVLNHYDAMTVGELPHTPDPVQVLRYVGSGDKQLNMVFQFDIVDLGIGRPNKYDYTGHGLKEMKSVVAKWQSFIDGTDGWTTAFCENHDQGRSVSRYASDAPEHREASARMLAVMMATMTGTLFLYQGQEIGMINAPKNWPIEVYQDVESLNYYNSVAKLTNNDPKALARVMNGIHMVGRDNARLPMQWDDSANAGFTEKGGKPWMRVHDLYPEINVAKQEKDGKSVLNFWKKMLMLRKDYKDLFIHGSFELFDPEDERTFVYAKEYAGQKAVVVLNFTAVEQEFKRPAVRAKWELLVGSFEDVNEDVLKPYEGRVYLVS